MNNDFKVTDFSLLTAEEAKSIDRNFLQHKYMWWLRSPGEFTDTAAFAGQAGYISTEGADVYDAYIYVRPALYFESENLQIGNKIRIGNEFINHEFTVVANGIALMNGDIGGSMFGFGVNDYEKSEVKKKVDLFFEKEIVPDLKHKNMEIIEPFSGEILLNDEANKNIKKSKTVKKNNGKEEQCICPDVDAKISEKAEQTGIPASGYAAKAIYWNWGIGD